MQIRADCDADLRSLFLQIRALQWRIIVQMNATTGVGCKFCKAFVEFAGASFAQTFLQIFDLHKFARKFEVRKVIESHR